VPITTVEGTVKIAKRSASSRSAIASILRIGASTFSSAGSCISRQVEHCSVVK